MGDSIMQRIIDMAAMAEQLEPFVVESNHIEGIADTTEAHVAAHLDFLRGPVTIANIAALPHCRRPQGKGAVMDIDAIIEQLSPPARAAVCGRFEWPSIDAAEIGEQQLFDLGLWALPPKGKRRPDSFITPLGKQVRAALKAAP